MFRRWKTIDWFRTHRALRLCERSLDVVAGLLIAVWMFSFFFSLEAKHSTPSKTNLKSRGFVMVTGEVMLFDTEVLPAGTKSLEGGFAVSSHLSSRYPAPRAAWTHTLLGIKVGGLHHSDWSSDLIVIPIGWIGTAVLGGPIVILIYRAARTARRKAADLCAQCGYDLRGGTLRCPECGMPNPLPANRMTLTWPPIQKMPARQE